LVGTEKGVRAGLQFLKRSAPLYWDWPKCVPTSEGDPDIETVAGLLEDRTVREILTKTSQEPMSATALKRHCDASGPTIYRRLERLRDAEFVVERTRPDPDGGHHRRVYAPNVDRITIDLENGSLSMQITSRERMADRFTRFVEEM
jgi:DNA-binding transcriptional ArsR family regulator